MTSEQPIVLDPWPFITTAVQLKCQPTSGSGLMTTVISGDNQEYALNSSARGRYPSVDAIWRRNPNMPAIMVPIGHVEDAAAALCDGSGKTRVAHVRYDGPPLTAAQPDAGHGSTPASPMSKATVGIWCDNVFPDGSLVRELKIERSGKNYVLYSRFSANREVGAT